MDQLTQQFMASAVHYNDDSSLFLKHRVQTMLNQNQIKFPGAQPVSLEPRRDITTVLNRNFKVCEKTDGTRYLLYLDLSDMEISEDIFEMAVKADKEMKAKCYFVDREYNFEQMDCRIRLNVLLEVIKEKTLSALLQFKMLLDGEVVADGQELDFYIFDCLYLNQQVVSKGLTARLEAGYQATTFMRKIGSSILISLKSKTFVDKTEIQKILDIQKALKHHSDGLIFTAEDEPYVFGTNPHILKWKPKDENSVDLKIDLRTEYCNVLQPNGEFKPTTIYMFQFYAAVFGQIEAAPVEAGGVTVVSKEKFDKMENLIKKNKQENLILEVYWKETKPVSILKLISKENGINKYQIEEKQGGWEAKKQRVDKSIPNDRKVFDSVCKSFGQFVSIEDLMQIIAGKMKVPGVCIRENPFVRRKQGWVQQVNERYE
ncbi:MRNA_capping enzyme alpha subunit [Hexamita inflata]|uniref:mRNA guanylyltransferase n=1 Tax=Hexamita inflata TaxID=28002 RepID=A0AA86PED0_9EUKA|nr:MRNA capping enzyme alpha subunit [Hexamita inflata]CAI9949091.1 MRNA capping enzyme alpha subunit [Hexamita inflata]CAI9958884.1 MRNA capping enzyme alpha subunit [Hexamita inflata]